MSMYPKNMFFTSESVTEGHPDKFCDLISDAVLDECLRVDPLSRVACECYVTMGLLNVGGEITTDALFDVAKVVRDLGNDVGYTSPKFGFDVNTAAVVRTIHAQSPDISQGVGREGGAVGAGDQGLMFGYACRQPSETACVLETATVEAAIGTLRDKRIGCVLVTETDGRLAGIFTERDVLERVATDEIDRGTAVLRDFMTPDPETIESDHLLAHAFHLMMVNDLRYLPVVDEKRRPTGVVSSRDPIDYIAELVMG